MSPRVCIAAGLVLVLVASASPAGAQAPLPIFAGDPTDPATSRPYEILPGVPLILPQPDGRFRPPIVVTGTVGDVDLVVRAGTPVIGPEIPPPTSPLVAGVAGGTHLAAGVDIPFTVAVSDGSAATPSGHPLLGPEMDGIPVFVAVFADLDGDGLVGPTDADPDGALDNARERQESDFVVGRSVAVFQNGVATGSVAVWKGAPASTGGLRVVLTAMTYAGPYVPDFLPGSLLGNVPDGPAVGTLLPFFPRLDPLKVIEAGSTGDRPTPEGRLGVILEPAFDVPVGDPVLGTPFALPTDGSSPTIDRAAVVSGAFSRARFVRPSTAATVPIGVEVPLLVGADGALWEPLSSVDLVDDGPGNGVAATLVPVDLFDQITDPAPGTTVTLVAGPGLSIVSPDTDADPTRETVALTSAGGVVVGLDDAGGSNDSGVASTLTVLVGGVPAETLAIGFTPGPPGPPDAVSPTIALLALAGNPAPLATECPGPQTAVAVVTDPQGDATSVGVTTTVDGNAVGSLVLLPGTAPAGMTLPPGQVFLGVFTPPAGSTGQLGLTAVAHDAAAHDSPPVAIALPLAAKVPPVASTPILAPATITAGMKQTVVITAQASDDCSVRSVAAQIDRGKGYKRLARLRDDGKKGDLVAGDGVYTGAVRLKLKANTFPVRTSAKDRRKLVGTSAPTSLTVVAP